MASAMAMQRNPRQEAEERDEEREREGVWSSEWLIECCSRVEVHVFGSMRYEVRGPGGMDGRG